MKAIIITENQYDVIKKHQAVSENNSLDVFRKEIKRFIYNLMTNGDAKGTSDYWLVNGIKKTDLKNKLIKQGIIISDSDKTSVPKKGFYKKIDRLYYELFDEQEPGMLMQEDDGGGVSASAGDGATTAFASSGSYESPLGHIQRRKIHKI